MAAPEELIKLVEDYKKYRNQYLSSDYDEYSTRSEYIDKLFMLLGWNVYNDKPRLPEQNKEVLREQNIDSGKPDYTFRLGQTTKFYVEAKKPSYDITDKWQSALQIRGYAWNSKLSLSVLTNFEDLYIYDCRFPPKRTDKPHVHRVKHFDFTTYIDDWDELYSILSRDAVWYGQFDDFAAKEKTHGTSEVDEEFLKDIESWRKDLAVNVALRNQVTLEQMNFAVPKLIDRLIFLRICEDRKTEEERQLFEISRKDNIYKNLVELFRAADKKYNSGLFHFEKRYKSDKPDEYTSTLTIDDKVLKKIIEEMYYPKSQYQFHMIPVDILGQVYEQFLGKVIRLTAGNQAKIEEKPEVKKAGGVFYTPKYIVDYIVENTVGKLCEGKTPDEMKKLTILDPACGSGSFLIDAYQYLLDQHLNWYVQNGPENFPEKIFPIVGDSWQLFLSEKKEILLSSIYGVDIDGQAVEVTKLNLLLKALEGESKESIKNLLKHSREPALPDLLNNIKCGNSLVDFDILDNLQDLSEEEQFEELGRINPFRWKSGFSEIMKAGGFDVVIGNPPYIKEFTHSQPFKDIQKSSLSKYYEGKMDIWQIFTCLAYDLLKENGLHSFIATNNWITSYGAKKIRRKVLEEGDLIEFIDFGDFKVFKNVGIQTMIYIIRKTGKTNNIQTKYSKIMNSKTPQVEVNNYLFLNEKTQNIINFYANIQDSNYGDPFTFINKEVSNIVDSIMKQPHQYIDTKNLVAGIDVHQDFINKKHLLILKDNSINVGDGIFVISKAELDAMKLLKTWGTINFHSSMIWAAEKGQIKAMELLQEWGVTDFEFAPEWAAKPGQIEATKLLKEWASVLAKQELGGIPS